MGYAGGLVSIIVNRPQAACRTVGACLFRWSLETSCSKKLLTTVAETQTMAEIHETFTMAPDRKSLLTWTVKYI